MENQIYHKTPILKSHYLAEKGEKKVFYKMDCYQPAGSFKIRGMETLCRDLKVKGHQRLLASSGGNAGYSLAYVGKKLELAIKVIVPETTSSYMVHKIKALGAEVEIHGKDWDETHQYATKLSNEQQIPYVSPFDDPLLWKGHASIIDECAVTMAEPDRVVVAVGGGGLLLGVMQGLKRNGWLSTKIIAAETTGAASYAASLAKRELVTLESIDTIATSLGAKTVAAELMNELDTFDISSYVINDNGALKACERLLEEYNVLVEPACGAALSYGYEEEFQGTTLIIVCGGVNINLKNLNDYKNRLG